MSNESRDWMYRPRQDNVAEHGICDEFRAGLDEFFRVAKSHPDVMNRDQIRCPCKKCKNFKFMDERDVRVHLYQWGFTPNYYWWTAQGEEIHTRGSMNQMEEDNNIPQAAFHDMVNDVLGSSNTSLEDPNPSTKKFYKELEDAHTPLYEGCETHSTLSVVARLLSIKSDFNLSQDAYNRILELIKEILPQPTKLPSNFYHQDDVPPPDTRVPLDLSQDQIREFLRRSRP